VKEYVGLDTGFFVKLLALKPEAVEIHNQISEGKIVGVVSVIVTFELRRLAMRGVVNRQGYQILEKSWDILFQVEPISKEIALEAAALSHGTGLPAADAMIYTTYRKVGCSRIYTSDKDFLKVPRKSPKIILLE